MQQLELPCAPDSPRHACIPLNQEFNVASYDISLLHCYLLVGAKSCQIIAGISPPLCRGWYLWDMPSIQAVSPIIFPASGVPASSSHLWTRIHDHPSCMARKAAHVQVALYGGRRSGSARDRRGEELSFRAEHPEVSGVMVPSTF